MLLCKNRRLFTVAGDKVVRRFARRRPAVLNTLSLQCLLVTVCSVFSNFHVLTPIPMHLIPIPIPFPSHGWHYSHSHANPMGPMGSQSSPFPCTPLLQSTHSITQHTHPFNGLLSGTTQVSRYQKGRTSLDLNEARDDEVLGCYGISWTICKQSAPRSRQITTPTPRQSMFTGRMLFLTPSQQCQSTEGT